MVYILCQQFHGQDHSWVQISEIQSQGLNKVFKECQHKFTTQAASSPAAIFIHTHSTHSPDNAHSLEKL